MTNHTDAERAEIEAGVRPLRQWWKLVPPASTTDMRIAYQRNRDDGFDAAYRAMLADAPQPLEGAPVPPGWKLVPWAATTDMRLAYQRSREDGFEAAYQALLAAAPTPTKPLTDTQILEAIRGAKKIPHDQAGWVREQRIQFGRAIERAHGIRDVSEWLLPTAAPESAASADTSASTVDLEARLAKALEALKSALNTAKFERHPFRSWQLEAVDALGLSGIKVDFPGILRADDGLLEEAQG